MYSSSNEFVTNNNNHHLNKTLHLTAQTLQIVKYAVAFTVILVIYYVCYKRLKSHVAKGEHERQQHHHRDHQHPHHHQNNRLDKVGGDRGIDDEDEYRHILQQQQEQQVDQELQQQHEYQQQRVEQQHKQQQQRLQIEQQHEKQQQQRDRQYREQQQMQENRDREYEQQLQQQQKLQQKVQQEYKQQQQRYEQQQRNQNEYNLHAGQLPNPPNIQHGQQQYEQREQHQQQQQNQIAIPETLTKRNETPMGIVFCGRHIVERFDIQAICDKLPIVAIAQHSTFLIHNPEPNETTTTQDGKKIMIGDYRYPYNNESLNASPWKKLLLSFPGKSQQPYLRSFSRIHHDLPHLYVSVMYPRYDDHKRNTDCGLILAASHPNLYTMDGQQIDVFGATNFEDEIKQNLLLVNNLKCLLKDKVTMSVGTSSAILKNIQQTKDAFSAINKLLFSKNTDCFEFLNGRIDKRSSPDILYNARGEQQATNVPQLKKDVSIFLSVSFIIQLDGTYNTPHNITDVVNQFKESHLGDFMTLCKLSSVVTKEGKLPTMQLPAFISKAAPILRRRNMEPVPRAQYVIVNAFLVDVNTAKQFASMDSSCFNAISLVKRQPPNQLRAAGGLINTLTINTTTAEVDTAGATTIDSPRNKRSLSTSYTEIMEEPESHDKPIFDTSDTESIYGTTYFMNNAIEETSSISTFQSNDEDSDDDPVENVYPDIDDFIQTLENV